MASVDFQGKSSKEIQEAFATYTRWIQSKIENENGKVLIFQERDSSEAISLAIAYLVAIKNKSLHEAWIQLNHLRYDISISEHLMRELCEFRRNYHFEQ